MADKAHVEHELVPLVLVVLYDDGVAHHFEAPEIGSNDALHVLPLGDHVCADIREGILGDDDLFSGRLAPYSRTALRVKLGEEDGAQLPLLAAALFSCRPPRPRSPPACSNTWHHC